MVSTATDHFRAYKPRPFTKQERENVTILYGGLHWRAERLIQGALSRLGYTTRILPPATKADLLTGRAVADIGQCCPTSFTTGNLLNFLQEEIEQSGLEKVVKKYVYLTAGACGACRFGQYVTFRQAMLHGLEGADRAAELASALEIVDRHPQRRPHRTGRFGGQRYAPPVGHSPAAARAAGGGRDSGSAAASRWPTA